MSEKPQRDKRIIVYVNEANLIRWKKLFIDMSCKNYEDALMRLLDLYELCAKVFEERKHDELVKKVREVLEPVRMKLVR